jgi:hypothetical protein
VRDSSSSFREESINKTRKIVLSEEFFKTKFMAE